MMVDTAYPAANALKKAKNLSDVADAATARGNLGLGALATGADGTDVPYTPTTGGDWTDPDPVHVAEGLDDLASRLTAHEAATVDITDVADGDVYTRSGAGVAGTTLGDLATGTINDLTAQGTPTGGTDYVAIWDAGLGAHRKVLLNDLPGGGGGEVNTASTEGAATGQPVYSQKVGVDLRFHGVSGSEGVTTSLIGEDVDVQLDVSSLTADATPDGAADYVVTYDADAASHKKVLLNNLPGGGGGGGGALVTSTVNDSTLAVGNEITFDTLTQSTGFGVTLAANTITLPAGRWYMVRYDCGGRTTSSGGYIDMRIYDVTGAATAISPNTAQYLPQNYNALSRFPAQTAALVDATAADVDIQVRVTAAASADFITAQQVMITGL